MWPSFIIITISYHLTEYSTSISFMNELGSITIPLYMPALKVTEPNLNLSKITHLILNKVVKIHIDKS